MEKNILDTNTITIKSGESITVSVVEHIFEHADTIYVVSINDYHSTNKMFQTLNEAKAFAREWCVKHAVNKVSKRMTDVMGFLDKAFNAYGDESLSNRTFDAYRAKMIENEDGSMVSLTECYNGLVLLEEYDGLRALVEFNSGERWLVDYCGFAAPDCWKSERPALTDAERCVLVKCIDLTEAEECHCRPELLSHNRPDSWERLEKDALEFARDNQLPHDVDQMERDALDLIRRAKALAGVER